MGKGCLQLGICQHCLDFIHLARRQVHKLQKTLLAQTAVKCENVSVPDLAPLIIASQFNAKFNHQRYCDRDGHFSTKRLDASENLPFPAHM